MATHPMSGLSVVRVSASVLTLTRKTRRTVRFITVMVLDPIHQVERRTRLITPLRGQIEIHVGRVERLITASECGVCVENHAAFVFVENAVPRSFLTFERSALVVVQNLAGCGFFRPERHLEIVVEVTPMRGDP